MAKEPKSKYKTEDIPDKDNINRWAIFSKSQYIPSLIESLLSFKDGSEESCNWEKYLSDITEIHKSGQETAALRSSRSEGKEYIYCGYARYNSGKLRAIKSPIDAKEASVKIDHVPSNENQAHSHVAIKYKPLKLRQVSSYYAQQIELRRIEYVPV